MLFKAFRALSSSARDRDRALEDPYLDRPTSRRQASAPDPTQRQLQEPLDFDNLHISESDSDEYGLPQARKSSSPRHESHTRTTSREQIEIEYKCPGCGDTYRVGQHENLQACKYCRVKPSDPRRRNFNRPQLGPLPNKQIRTPGHLEESFRSLYFRLGVILHDEETDHGPENSPRGLAPSSNGERSPMMPPTSAQAGPSQLASPFAGHLDAAWSPKKGQGMVNEHSSHTPPARVPPSIPTFHDTPRLMPAPPSGLRQSRTPASGENAYLSTPHQMNRPISRGSPMLQSTNTSPRKRVIRAPPTLDGGKSPQMAIPPKARAKYQLIESFRADFSSLYGDAEFLNNDFCSSIRPKMSKRSLSESSAISLKSQEEGVMRPNVARHDSAKPSTVRFDVHGTFRPTPTLQPVLPDSKALLAGHLHDVVSSLADYKETRHIGRSATLGRKSTYQTSPHISYSELHTYHSILIRFTMDVTYCLSLVTRSEDTTEKLAQFKNEVAHFTAQLLVCCLDTISELLTSARAAPSAPQGVRYLFLILTTPWLRRSLIPLATGYSQWHDAQVASGRQDAPGRFDEEAKQLLLQQSPGRKTSSTIRDRVISLCLGRIANLPENVQQVLPRWFANMPVNMYVELTRTVQEANTRAIRSIPEQEQHTSDKVKKLHDRRFLTEMLGAANIDHFSEDTENLPLYTKKKSAWKVRTSCHTFQLFVVANDIRTDTAARHTAHISQGRPTDDDYQPFSVDYFYTPLLDPEAGRLDISLDFELWDSTKHKFTICQYPFLLTLGTKARILEYDNERRKKEAVRQEWHASKGMSAEPYFHLNVKRENIIEDSFKAVRQAVGSMSNVTSKKLRVHFEGEEAVDAGGVQKEWFLLLTQKLFSPELGLFYVSDSGEYWFHTACSRPNEYYELVGAVFGLAIYNQTPLFAPFPHFLFKKLAAAAPRQGGVGVSWRHIWRPTLQDLAQLSPDLARVMKQALADPSTMAGLNFEIPIWQNGRSEYAPLGPDGSSREITALNVDEFVEKAVNYVLKESVSIQFTAFARGFHSICGGNALSLFRGEELELLVRGSEDFDLDTLRAAVLYKNWKRLNTGLSTEEDLQSEDEVSDAYPVVRFFWAYFHRADIKDRRRILQFITGTDRLPPAGIVNLVIKISRQNMDKGEFRYPSARTCFNQILLPDCFGEKDQEIFDRVFGNALDMAGTGFGMK